MPKLLLSVITGVVLAAGAASAQTATPDRPPNERNPEATCPVGANCAPGQASSTSAPAASTGTTSDVTGSTARPSSEKNPEHTCPPGSKC
jgi:hypothetical protein